MDPTQRQAAERQLTAVLVMLALLFTIHLCGVGSTLLNFGREVMDPNGIFAAIPQGLSDEEMGERVGRGIGLLMGGLYSVLGLVWIPLNAWGVYGRRPWARASSLAYFATTILTCCCAPFGAFGLYALLRADVRALFEERRA